MRTDQLKTPIALYGMRLPQDDKRYYQRQLMTFAQHMADRNDNIKRVTFGRHDQRGGIEVCLEHADTCVTRWRGFFNRDELLGYVQGYNDSQGD